MYDLERYDSADKMCYFLKNQSHSPYCQFCLKVLFCLTDDSPRDKYTEELEVAASI